MVDLNSAYEADLYIKYLQNPNSVSKEWQDYFRKKYEGVHPKLERKVEEYIEQMNGYREFPTVSLNEIKTTVEDDLVLISSVQEKIAENMEMSLSVPTATSVRTIPVKVLDENRRIINKYLEKFNLNKITFTHIITWAIIRALSKFPHLNDAFVRQDGKSYRLRRRSINLGFAVDLVRKDGSRMLMVPNIKGVEKLRFDEFVKRYDDLIARTRTGKVSVEELQNTTISITNPGMIGTTMSNPRLMRGQSLIIAIGSIDYPTEFKAVKPEVLTTFAISKVVTITNTYDHRIIQGAESAEFLSYIQELLLGAEQFYDSIFATLHIPFEPVRWEVDTTPVNKFGRVDEEEIIEKSAHVELMINAYRVRGHLLASTNPLGYATYYYPELNPAYYGFTIWDLDRIFHAEDLWEKNNLPLREIIERLRDTYCGSIGYEFMHIQDPEKKDWVKKRLELIGFKDFTNEEKVYFLKKLIEAEEFENFLHTKYVGHKRFSLEGGESTIVLIDKLFQLAAKESLLGIVVGMAHRGRLNLIANQIGKPIEEILIEFEGDVDPDSFWGSGDVKYHLGAEGKYISPDGKEIPIILSPNPSHLEFVDPVVEGIARALINNFGDKSHKKVLPILIHGDSAFAGQGVVAETLNLSQLHGYRTGGTIHIVINNQLGFTTPATEARSSYYATDIAKGLQVPILHVNGNDPEAVAKAAIFAFEYRQTFNTDVIIDLLCYRKYGHNEADEPTYTQPLLYKKIRSLPPISEVYKERLVRQGIIREETATQFEREYQEKLQNSFIRMKSNKEFKPTEELLFEFNPFQKIDTSVPFETIQRVGKALTSIPNGFHLNPKLVNLLNKRKKLLENIDSEIDWAFAESLAFGTILLDGYDIRFSGQDSRRGTFSQRHSVLVDFETEEEYIPLNHIEEKQGKLRIFDSPLSETAILGFEYGYSLYAKNSLVFWEAQFGDFANVAQPIFDQFISAGEKKWGKTSNLIVLLPHSYDGQGPEHSSARLERFLQLCAENNMIVANLTTPANYFHILRRQMHLRKPLILMTPKSMLRHPLAVSSIRELTDGYFQEIIEDNLNSPNTVEKVIFVTGKVYWDLISFIQQKNISKENFAIVRIEQLYPLNKELLLKIVAKYKNAVKFVWFQEEPQNMGAWSYIFENSFEILPKDKVLHYIGRAKSASPATGSFSKHNREQIEIIESVINF
ncbi:MAG: multifunctional oxoglutarate decarboxylase/oxoglutarate dehydrogenase thiamine pyrophosphate-binding subunit/dihydrolipoyllysine-residue succinyltransferase subunit [Ignavibacteria bacterium]|nr:multifunctional oxoglutarate decarboxylase/oxoglutarate dehydrogenase thiamine pyrophosphate-binding subunit/dihydrolipoyllysine-residue succinyltransferase subunit [Ignavibacteria bacterium]